MSKLISKIVVPDSSEATGYALYNVKDANAIPASEKGVASGVATLDSSGKVPSSQLPSYVDDVIEGYYHDNKFYNTYGEFIEGDDVAQAVWGEGWRMPTAAEFQALGNAVNTSWTSDYNSTGIAGLVCTDKTDNTKVLFFPAAGNALYSGVHNVGKYGLYWSSSLYFYSSVKLANRLNFENGNVNWYDNGNRCYGYPVRPILASGDSTRPYVEIGGVKWSTMNIGASTETDAGLYFQWGDTQGYTASQIGTDKTFSWTTYKYCDGTDSVMTKYNSTDGLTTLIVGQAGGYSGEITAETGKIYVDIPTNQSYRWSGSTYIVISSPYVLPTASANTLGGIKVGNNLFIDANGVLSATGGSGVQSDWDQTDSTADDYIKNKPIIPEAVAIKGNAETSYRTGNVNITPANIGLGNVGNFKAVSTVASQGLTATEQLNARSNIGAGTSSFSGSYDDLSNKPTIPSVSQSTGTSTTAVMSQKAVTDELDGKVDKVSGKGLSTNDYTTDEKNKLAGIASGAEVNVQSDWNATSGDAFIKNKPTIPTVPTKVSAFTNDSGYITGITKAMVTTALGYTPPTSDTNTWRTVQCNGTSIGNNTLNIKAGANVSLSNSNGTITITSTDTNTWPTYTSQLTNNSGFKGISTNSFSGTTSANGNVINEWTSAVMIIGATCTSPADTYICVPYATSSTLKSWRFHLMTDTASHTVAASKRVTITVTYFEL